MLSVPLQTLGAVAATRPVFMIVMGISLMIFALRMSKTAGGRAGWLMVPGAMALCLGYAVLVPLYDAGLIPRISPGRDLAAFSASTIFCHVAKLVLMNAGWLAFGLGAAMHAGLLQRPATRRAAAEPAIPHESVA